MTKVKFLTIQFSNAASRSRRATRASFVLNVLPTLNRRAQGMPGARRARSRVRKVESTRVSHHGHAGNTRHSPRNGFNGCFALSPVTGLSCTVASGVTSTNLTPASGRQDHTTSPSARSAPSSTRRLRPSHPVPTFVTIAKRPSGWDGMARDVKVIWVKWEREYFCKGDWTGRHSLNWFSKSSFTSNAREAALTTDTAPRPCRRRNA
jgi:hypothetical protein